jgi:outer membrane protein OmpA-like peptidoglycan-associated protein
MQKPTSTGQVESEQQLEQIRALILGKNNRIILESIKKDARNIVGNVLTEALHDRQKKDGSVNKVLLPLIEDSVAHSVMHHSDKLVNSLYPLMGSLVRKSVTSFLADFMEKTNQLIDSSFTIKGLKWRIEAWQAGVNFSQYVASQTFSYRVEHVLLIHRETGLLLNFVDLGKASKGDADLISSMLTAINDFVGDSFLDNDNGLKEQLQTVTTDNFNLLIKPGPSALIAAAVMGNPPHAISEQLQVTLEEIHRLYNDELNQFDGDNQSFANSEALLLDCLLSEQKKTESSTEKKPWFAWILVFIIAVIICLKTFQWWENERLTEKLMMLDNQPGIIVNKIYVHNDKQVELDILRDPNAIGVSEWLQKQDLTIESLALVERQYYSLSPEILLVRAQQILAQYSQIQSNWQNEVLNLSGTIDLLQLEKLLNALATVGFSEGNNLNIQDIKLPSSNIMATDKKVTQQIFNELVARISIIQLDFSVKSDKITPTMTVTLQQLYQYLQQLELLADELEFNIGLLVIGCSDNSGNRVNNAQLSLQRAKNSRNVLSKLGFSEQKMFITGLGQIDIEKVNNQARKVMFNVLFAKKE